MSAPYELTYKDFLGGKLYLAHSPTLKDREDDIKWAKRYAKALPKNITSDTYIVLIVDFKAFSLIYAGRGIGTLKRFKAKAAAYEEENKITRRPKTKKIVSKIFSVNPEEAFEGILFFEEASTLPTKKSRKTKKKAATK